MKSTKNTIIPVNPFIEKFKTFNNLINDNEKAHSLMSTISELVHSGKPFNSLQANKYLEDLFKIIENMIISLENLTGRDNIILKGKLKSLKIDVRLALIPKIKISDEINLEGKNIGNYDLDRLYNETPLFFNLNELDNKHLVQVGNKMSRLGELKNKLQLNVPDGFSLSIKFFDEILSHNNLRQKKNTLLRKIEFNKYSSIKYVCNQIQALIISQELPSDIEKKIYEAYYSVFKNNRVNLAVRSSAYGEDSNDYSFAGLHKSILNVSFEYLIDSIVEVITSFYSPQSVTYRYLSGIRDEDMPMSVGCIEMIDAKVAGVLYTQDPNGIKKGMIIQAVRGLGSQVVDGTIKPQEFILTRLKENFTIEFNSEKYDFLTNNDNLTIGNPLSQGSCLNHQELFELYENAKKIEDYFKVPQDIEWAISKEGKLYILQARTLKIFNQSSQSTEIDLVVQKAIENNPVLITKGECASSGIGFGKVYKINSLRDISHVPDGSVLVARKNFLELTSVIHKVSAIVTDVGSTTGHLSIIARELNKPLITNTDIGSEILNNGDMVTVFADKGLVFIGLIKDLIEIQKKNNINNSFVSSPVYSIWSNLINKFFKLNLIDSNSPEFKQVNCQTIHDLIRFTHEKCMQGMFEFYTDSAIKSVSSYKLNINIPLEIYLIDLGNGIKEASQNTIEIDQIESKPFLSLIEGMLTEGLSWSGFVSLDTKGFSEMILSGAVSNNTSQLAESSKSYAFVSENYINFFSQLGYHFSRIDAVATENTQKNYINFNFRGGASTDIRKARRAKAIQRILEHHDFMVTQNADDVIGRIKGISNEEVLKIIKMLGNLMGAVRNSDVIMLTDDHSNKFVELFLSGDPSPAQHLMND